MTIGKMQENSDTISEKILKNFICNKYKKTGCVETVRNFTILMFWNVRTLL